MASSVAWVNKLLFYFQKLLLRHSKNPRSRAKVSRLASLHSWVAVAACRMEFGFRNLGNFCLWKSRILGLGIRNTAQGIRNPSSPDKDRNTVSGIRNTVSVKPRIQDCLEFRYMLQLHRLNNQFHRKWCGINKIVNVKVFSKKEIKYFSRTSTEFKDFSRWLPKNQDLFKIVRNHGNSSIQLNPSTTDTLGTENSRRCRQLAVVERFKQEPMYETSAKNSGRKKKWPLLRGGHK